MPQISSKESLKICLDSRLHRINGAAVYKLMKPTCKPLKQVYPSLNKRFLQVSTQFKSYWKTFLSKFGVINQIFF